MHDWRSKGGSSRPDPQGYMPCSPADLSHSEPGTVVTLPRTCGLIIAWASTACSAPVCLPTAPGRARHTVTAAPQTVFSETQYPRARSDSAGEDALGAPVLLEGRAGGQRHPEDQRAQPAHALPVRRARPAVLLELITPLKEASLARPPGKLDRALSRAPLPNCGPSLRLRRTTLSRLLVCPGYANISNPDAVLIVMQSTVPRVTGTTPTRRS